MEKRLERIEELQPELIENTELRALVEEKNDRVEALQEKIANYSLTLSENMEKIHILAKENAKLQHELLEAHKELSEVTVYVFGCFILLKRKNKNTEFSMFLFSYPQHFLFYQILGYIYQLNSVLEFLHFDFYSNSIIYDVSKLHLCCRCLFIDSLFMVFPVLLPPHFLI